MSEQFSLFVFLTFISSQRFFHEEIFRTPKESIKEMSDVLMTIELQVY